MFRLRYAALNMTVIHKNFHRVKNLDGANFKEMFRLRCAALNMTIIHKNFHRVKNLDGANSEGIPRQARNDDHYVEGMFRSA